MRILGTTVVAVALSTASAHAQQPPWMSLPTKDQASDHAAEEHSKVPKADDKAYRSALDGIPQIKDRDPWGNVRLAPKSKSSR
jgi:hypothetical protein